jgi:ribosomal protein L2
MFRLIGRPLWALQRPLVRFSSTTVGSTEPVVKEELFSRTSLLTIPPRDADLTTLEKQDEIIKRRRKLAKTVVEIKKFKPRSPGRRWFRAPIYPYLWKGAPYKPLTAAIRATGGRNNTGHITVRFRGGGHKRRARIVDFTRSDAGKQKVMRIEYDPTRTAHIALMKNLETKNMSYYLACDGMRAGDIVESYRQGIPQDLMAEMGGKVDPAILSARTNQKGNCLPLRMIPVGAVIHAIGISKEGPAKFCRSAGTYGRLMQKLPEKNKAVVKLQSGEQRYVHLDACATLGIVSNIDHQHAKWGKAGRSRHRGFRPRVRGVAMNKCDHPHGGGRGKSKSNKLSMSPWGVLAKGYKTRRGKHQNNMKVRDRPRGKAGRGMRG